MKPMKPKLGSGKRFAALAAALSKKPGVSDAKGLAAYLARKKYGKKRTQELATAGKRRKK